MIFFSFFITSSLRPKISKILVIIILLPGLAALWTASQQIVKPSTPEAFELTLVGLGALLVNFICTIVLMDFRKNKESLMKAAFLSARNDVLSNLAIITAGLVIMIYPSIWPDLIVGIIIFLINFDAAYKLYQIAKNEGHNLAS